MKNCEYCNAEIKDESKFCPYCGNTINDSDEEKEVVVTEVVDNNTDNKPYINTAPGIEGKTIALAVLSFIIPIVGFLLFFSWKNTKPRDAKILLISATIGFINNYINLSNMQ